MNRGDSGLEVTRAGMDAMRSIRDAVCADVTRQIGGS